MQFIEKLMLVFNTGELGYVGIYKYITSVHIMAGVISIVSGLAILLMLKGSSNHKNVGKVFVAAMLFSGAMGPILGTLGEITQPSPINPMTAISGLFVMSIAWSGWRLAKVGMRASTAIDKVMLYLGIISAVLYLYVAVFVATGISGFGFQLLSFPAREAVTLDMHTYGLFQRGAFLMATSGGNIFGLYVGENIIAPVWYAVVIGLFMYQDWGRIMGTKKYNRTQVINQHLTRLLYMWGAAWSAVLLNSGLVSLWFSWVGPQVLVLLMAWYYVKFGYQKPERPGAAAKAA